MKIALRLFLVLALVWFACRSAIYLLPGDPADFLVHESLVQLSVEQLRIQMDLNKSFAERLFSLPASQSLVTHQNVLAFTATAFQRSLTLASLSLLFSGFFTLFLLYFSYFSVRARRVANAFSLLCASLPLFVLSPLLLLLFSIHLHWFPVTHNPILPALTLSTYLSGFWYRNLAHKINRYLPLSSAHGARSRGVSEATIFFKYVLYPCLGSFMGFLGTQMGNLLNGSVIVEIIFQWNGLGSALLDAVLSRDYPVIEVTLLWVTFITLFTQQLGYAIQRRMEPQAS